MFFNSRRQVALGLGNIHGRTLSRSIIIDDTALRGISDTPYKLGKVFD